MGNPIMHVIGVELTNQI